MALILGSISAETIMPHRRDQRQCVAAGPEH